MVTHLGKQSGHEARAGGTVSDAAEVPEGVPAALKISVAAAVVNVTTRSLRNLVDEDELKIYQLRKYRMRFIPTYELVRLAEELGLPLHWERAL